MENFFRLICRGSLLQKKFRRRERLGGTLGLSFRFVYIQCAPTIKAYNQVLSRSLKFSNLCSNHQSCIQIAGAVLSFWLLCNVEYFHTFAVLPPFVFVKLLAIVLTSGLYYLEVRADGVWSCYEGECGRNIQRNPFVCLFLARQTPPTQVGQGLLIHEVSRSHTTKINSL